MWAGLHWIVNTIIIFRHYVFLHLTVQPVTILATVFCSGVKLRQLPAASNLLFNISAHTDSQLRQFKSLTLTTLSALLSHKEFITMVHRNRSKYNVLLTLVQYSSILCSPLTILILCLLLQVIYYVFEYWAKLYLPQSINRQWIRSCVCFYVVVRLPQ